MKTAPVIMEAGPAEPRQTGSRNLLIAFAILALVISCFAVSSQSFWIDEAAAASKAFQPTLAGWCHFMDVEHGSDKQMPLYMLFLWVWERIAPGTEWWVRAAGIPFFIAGVCIFAANRIERWIVVLLSGFTWYCLDEARPYAMQLGSSLVCFGALERLAGNPSPRSERIWLGVFLTSLVVLSGSSLLGMIWAGTALAALGVFQLNQARPWRLLVDHKTAWIVTILPLTALAAFYLWTISLGAGASPVATTDWRNVVFVVSEFFGFNGLGPGRVALRADGASALRPYLLPLMVMAIPTAIVSAAGLWDSRKELRHRRGLLLAALACGTLAALLGLGVVKHFRVLGRHCTPIMPAVFWILAGGISSLWKRRRFFPRAIVAFFLIAAGASCLSIRLAARHAKDDYRSMSALARNALAKNQIVWWCADQGGGMIYGVPMPGETPAQSLGKVEPGAAILLWNRSPEELSVLPLPDFVFVSKPDLFDPRKTVTQFIADHHFERTVVRQAFEVWQPAASVKDKRETNSASVNDAEK